MRHWKIRTVRVPLNEQCWLGVSPVQAQYGGTDLPERGQGLREPARRQRHHADRRDALELRPVHRHSAGCSDVNATCQKPMPDAQYAPSFWTGVANAFKGNDAVVLDLFNEPYPERATGSATTGWTCWRDGGTCPGIGYQVAGFQSLVTAVRPPAPPTSS
jgi:hypothetical protein